MVDMRNIDQLSSILILHNLNKAAKGIMEFLYAPPHQVVYNLLQYKYCLFLEDTCATLIV